MNRGYTRGGPPQGPLRGPSMTERKMRDYHEGMDDLVDDFDDMGMDPRKHSTPGRPQGRRGPRHLNDMDAFNEENMNPRRLSVRGGSQGRTGMGRPRMDDMNGFREDGAGLREPSTKGGPQGRPDMGRRRMHNFGEDEIGPRESSTRDGPPSRAGMGRRRMDDMGGFHEDEVGSREPSTRGGPPGRVGVGRHRMNEMNGFGEDEIGPREPSIRGGPPGGSNMGRRRMDDMISHVSKGSHTGGSRAGSRTGVSRAGAGDSRAGDKYGARLMTDDIPHVPRGIRGPRPPITSSATPLRELEVELDRVEESKRRTVQASQTAKKSDLAFLNKKIEEAVFRSMELKNEIYKIDPKSERVDNTARFFLHLPYNPDLDHGKEGAPSDHGGRRGARVDARDHY